MAEALAAEREDGEPLMDPFRKEFEIRANPDIPDPELIPLQNRALDSLREARKLGKKTDILDSLAVAQELDALRLVL